MESWHGLIQDLVIMREEIIPVSELYQTFLQGSLPSLNFYLLLCFASLIATLGLLTNSAATIIGAMIIAPLMNPIIALAYNLVTLAPKILERSVFSIITGVILVIGISYLTTEFLGLKVVGSEILNRTQPNSLDLGVAIASGAAAAFSNTRRSISNALPGVAIAVALVPPLCVVGIGLFLGELGTSIAEFRGIQTNIPLGSFLLFLTNLVGIILSGSIVFLIQKYGSIKNAIIGLIISLLALFFLLEPLNFSLRNLYVESVVNRTIIELRTEQPEIFSQTAVIDSLNIVFGENDLLYVNIILLASSQDTIDISEKLNLISQEISQAINQPVKVSAKIFTFEEFDSSP